MKIYGKIAVGVVSESRKFQGTHMRLYVNIAGNKYD